MSQQVEEVECTHADQIREVTPNNDGCGECLAVGDRWVRWTPSVGQDWGEIKRGSRRSYAVYQCCVW